MTTSCIVNKLKVGDKILLKNEPYIIINNTFVNPGKGQSFNRLKVKKIISSKIIEKVFKSHDILKIANVIKIGVIYLYNNGELYYFMKEDNYEQIEAEEKTIKCSIKWLVKNQKYEIVIWNNKIINVIPPKFIKLLVLDTSLNQKNESINNNLKIAKLSNGLKIKVPYFIQKEEIIKVNTRSQEYVSRAKIIKN